MGPAVRPEPCHQAGTAHTPPVHAVPSRCTQLPAAACGRLPGSVACWWSPCLHSRKPAGRWCSSCCAATVVLCVLATWCVRCCDVCARGRSTCTSAPASWVSALPLRMGSANRSRSTAPALGISHPSDTSHSLHHATCTLCYGNAAMFWLRCYVVADSQLANLVSLRSCPKAGCS